MTGQIISYQRGHEGRNLIDLSDIPAGIYVLFVQEKDGILSGKFIKQ